MRSCLGRGLATSDSAIPAKDFSQGFVEALKCLQPVMYYQVLGWSDGQVVLCYDKKAWEKEVPDWGQPTYISLQQSQKYVLSDRRSFIEFLPNYL